MAASGGSAAKYSQIPILGPQEQLSSTPREGGVGRSHTLPGLHKGPENPHSMREKLPYPKHSQDRTTGLGACAGWPAAALASLLAGWPADAQPVLSRWHSSSLFTSLDGQTVIEAWSPAPVPLLLCTTLHGALTLMGATRDGCFLGKTNVCEPPHLCHLPKRRAHNWPAGPALQTACLWALPMVARGQLGWCLMAYLVSGAAICPGCAFVPVPAGSALLLHTCPRASTSDLLVSSTCPALMLKHWFFTCCSFLRSPGIALG